MSNEIDLTRYDERIARAERENSGYSVYDEDGEEIERLVAELKRCYERLDKANKAMLKVREVLMKHHEWMSVNDATSEEDDREILDVVKALREASE